MNKTCPVCGDRYTETAWRKTKAGGYRSFRHFDYRGVAWCRGETGKQYTQVVVLGTKP